MSKRAFFIGNVVIFAIIYSNSGAAGGAIEPNVAAGVKLGPQLSFAFAGGEKGREILGAPDQFLRALSPVDRSARLKTAKAVPEEDFVIFVKKNVTEWQPAEVDRLTRITAGVKAAAAPYKISYPETIWFIKTTGIEEGRACYTRANAIILPRNEANLPEPELTRRVYHELFHVISRYNPSLRARLYRVLGFEICPEIVLPEDLSNRRITNPDSPVYDSVTTVRWQGAETTVTPVLLASRDCYNERRGGEFFEYLMCRLLVVEKEGARFKAKLSGGAPVLLDINQVPEFRQRMCRNTHQCFIFQPEEIIADNFLMLLNPGERVSERPLLEKIRTILSPDGSGKEAK